MLLPRLDYEMNDVVGSCAIEGLKLSEVISLEKDNVRNSENNIIDTGTRQVKLSDSVFQKVLKFANTTHMPKTSRSKKDSELADSPYVIRLFNNKRATGKKVAKSSISNRLRQDLDNAGYEGAYKDLRTSAMINYFLDLKESGNEYCYENVNDKFGTGFKTNALFNVCYRQQIEVLQQKRELEKTRNNI